nr:hypothetical protein [Paenibacillus pseudetheri]
MAPDQRTEDTPVRVALKMPDRTVHTMEVAYGVVATQYPYRYKRRQTKIKNLLAMRTRRAFMT